jgi:hypothetical protein
MNKTFIFRKMLEFVSSIAFVCVSVGCGAYTLEDEQFAKRAATSSGSFAGNWKVKLTAVSDGCGLGIKGKSYNANVAIAQRGNKITLQIQGFPKAFKGTVSGSTASGTGTYTTDGITLRSSVTVTKTGAKKIKVNRANLNLKSSAQSCQLTFSGSGTKG